MWYEIIPSFAIMLGAAALMDPLCKVSAYLLYGRWSGFDFFHERGDFAIFLRDRDVAGTHWRMQGLETIED
ncbi:expressed conserved protein [Echinococcus multilocularis]|uniref:Expressed conserved protein n=1 Tax=Echinococcus multilocularis TaxID=6211 RepID=A0A087W053_ECHMU|nr:expressed conserved protein [Echinococcus multilocularis]